MTGLFILGTLIYFQVNKQSDQPYQITTTHKGIVVPVTPTPTDEHGVTLETYDLNSITYDQLLTLPDIGPTRAAAIVDFIDKNGPFTIVEDITKVSGIGDSTMKGLLPYLTISYSD